MIQNEHIEDRILLPEIGSREEDQYDMLVVLCCRELKNDIKERIGDEGLEVLYRNHELLSCLEPERDGINAPTVIQKARVYTLPTTNGRELYIDALPDDEIHQRMKILSLEERGAYGGGCVGVVMKK